MLELTGAPAHGTARPYAAAANRCQSHGTQPNRPVSYVARSTDSGTEAAYMRVLLAATRVRGTLARHAGAVCWRGMLAGHAPAHADAGKAQHAVAVPMVAPRGEVAQPKVRSQSPATSPQRQTSTTTSPQPQIRRGKRSQRQTSAATNPQPQIRRGQRQRSIVVRTQAHRRPQDYHQVPPHTLGRLSHSPAREDAAVGQ